MTLKYVIASLLQVLPSLRGPVPRGRSNLTEKSFWEIATGRLRAPLAMTAGRLLRRRFAPPRNDGVGLEGGEVFFEFVLRDVAAVIVPFDFFVLNETFEDVAAQGLAQEIGFFSDLNRLPQA